MTTDYKSPADEKLDEALEAAESARDVIREVLDGHHEGHDDLATDYVYQLAQFESWLTLMARRMR